MTKTKKSTTIDLGEFKPDALGIRTTDKEGRSYGGFQWPIEVGAVVNCPDWSAEPVCGYGLHALGDGIGDWGLTAQANGALWWVVEYVRAESVDLGGDKVKFPRCRVKYVGDFAHAMKMVQGATVAKLLEMAEGNTATGYRGHAAATGDRGHAAATGYSGHAAATGDSGHAAATGDRGHAAATGKDSIAASIGPFGTAEGAEGSWLVLAFYDTEVWPYTLQRVERFKVGNDGIKANTAYRLNADGQAVAA